jgi:hypothetical protein
VGASRYGRSCGFVAPEEYLCFEEGGAALQVMEKSHLTSRYLEHNPLTLQMAICWVVEAVDACSTPTSSAERVRPSRRVWGWGHRIQRSSCSQ